jgi:hypothetical protein
MPHALDAPPKILRASPFGKCLDVRGSRRRGKESAVTQKDQPILFDQRKEFFPIFRTDD